MTNKTISHIPAGIFDGNWKPYLLGAFIVTTAAFYVYNQYDFGENAFYIQGICFLLAFVWLMINSRNMVSSLSRIRFDQFELNQISIHPAWLFVIGAVILRYYAHSIFPPANQTGFEELETASNSYAFLSQGLFPIDFRFTNLIGALGLAISSDVSLSSLRYAFQLMGMMSLVFMVFSLRSLEVGWIPTLLITYIAATMRFLVIAFGVADELFASIPALTVMLFFIIQYEKTKTNQSFWLAAAGTFAGMMMFEYTSYRMPILVVIIWLLGKCFYKDTTAENSARSSACFNLFSFFVPFILVALPMFMQTVRQPDNSVFFEAFVRHGSERSTFFSERSLYQLTNHTLGLTGWPADVSAYYTPIGEPLVLPPVGWLFAISCLFGLLFMGRGLPRMLASGIIFTIVGASLLANNPNIGRMAPTFPLFLLLSGIFLEKARQKLVCWIKMLAPEKEFTFSIHNRILFEQGNPSQSDVIRVSTIEKQESVLMSYRQVTINLQKINQLLLKTVIPLLFLFFMGQVTLANLDALKRMAGDRQVINEYVNDEHSVCVHVGDVIQPGQRVYIYSSEGLTYCASPFSQGWYFGDGHHEVRHVTGQFVSPSVLVPGDLVVVGASNRGLNNEELSLLVDLGYVTDSLSSLRFSKNVAGRTTAGSICFQCDDLNK